MIEERPPFDIGAEPQRLLELNGAPWNKFFRADLLKQLHDFENPPKIFDDMMLHLLAFPHATRVAYCPDALVNYIIRNDSIMTTIDKSKLDSAYQAMLEVKSVYQDECPQLIPLLDAAAFLHMGTSLMFRISYDRQANLSEELSKNRIYLNDNFPSWSSDSIISSTNAKRYGGALKKLYLARRVYSIGLMRPALSLYRFMIHTLHIDIKW